MTPPRRRWFQFSLSECLILAPLLAVIWSVAISTSLRQLGFTDPPPSSTETAIDIAKLGMLGTVVVIGAWLVIARGHGRYRPYKPPEES